MRDAERRQPVPQRQKASHRRRELAHLLLALAALTRRAHGRRDLRLVHVQRPGTLHHLIHPNLPASRSTQHRRPQGPATTDESGKRAQGNSPAFRQDPAPYLTRASLTRAPVKDAASKGDNRNPRSFSRRPHGRSRPRILNGTPSGGGTRSIARPVLTQKPAPGDASADQGRTYVR